MPLMKTINPRRLAPALIAMGICSAGHVFAQSDEPASPPEAPQLPRYFVELLVFSNTGGAASTSERFEPKPQLTRIDATPADSRDRRPLAGVPIDSRSLLDAAAAPASRREPQVIDDENGEDEGSGQAADEFRFELIDSDQLKLTSERETLERLSAYTPIFHGGWVQEGYPQDRAKPFDINIIDSTTPLTGTVTLYRSRFLHVQVALAYPSEAARQTDQPLNPVESLYSVAVPAPRYEINEARRLRSGELHYLDHPAFGVLILITPEPERELLELQLETLPVPLPEPDSDQAPDS
jgi:hypothetical protein